jgi:hypothetical protein
MSIDRTLVICGDSLSRSTHYHSVQDSDGDCSVDFGLVFPASVALNAACVVHESCGSAHDSVHDCYYTERTKHQASQSSSGLRISLFGKKQKLEYWDPELSPSTASSITQELQENERHDFQNGKNLLYSGQEIFNTWILQFVRNT